MDPNSEEEILPSPLTSNFRNTCSKSSAKWTRDWNERDGVREIKVAFSVTVVGEDDVDFFRSFFFRLKRDRKPMMIFLDPKENMRETPSLVDIGD
jgi:hypothetical protein